MDQFNKRELEVIRDALDTVKRLSFGLNNGVNDLLYKVNIMICKQERKINNGSEWKSGHDRD